MNVEYEAFEREYKRAWAERLEAIRSEREAFMTAPDPNTGFSNIATASHTAFESYARVDAKMRETYLRLKRETEDNEQIVNTRRETCPHIGECIGEYMQSNSDLGYFREEEMGETGAREVLKWFDTEALTCARDSLLRPEPGIEPEKLSNGMTIERYDGDYVCEECPEREDCFGKDMEGVWIMRKEDGTPYRVGGRLSLVHVGNTSDDP